MAAPRLDAIGVVMDFHDLERRVNLVVDPFHNRHLNEIPPFDRLNPSAGQVAAQIGSALRLPDDVMLKSVEVWETDENSAVYRT